MQVGQNLLMDPKKEFLHRFPNSSSVALGTLPGFQTDLVAAAACKKGRSPRQMTLSTPPVVAERSAAHPAPSPGGVLDLREHPHEELLENAAGCQKSIAPS